MKTYSHDSSRADQPSEPSEARGAPGKRTLTQGLAPGRGEPAELTPRAIRRARRKNPRWQRRLGFDAAPWSSAPIDSAEFAHDVAARQRQAGVRVDGIVGPETVAIMAPAADPGQIDVGDDDFDPSARYVDSRATFEAPPDDPFALHLLAER